MSGTRPLYRHSHRFRPRLLPASIAVLVCVGLIGLGCWQLQRMHEKEALFAEFESGDLITLPLSRIDPNAVARYQHVLASGRYDSDRQFLLDNMTHQGRAGYRVLTPLVSVDESVVLVDRGWLPAGPTRAQLPGVAVSQTLRGLSGRLDLPPRAGIELAAQEESDWPRVISYPKISELEHALGRRVFPYVILLDADQPDGYVREWRPSTFPPQRHLGYAITWFALAAAAAIAFIIVSLRKETP